MDVQHVNSLIDGQLKNTEWSLLEAEDCQLWGMRGHVLLGKWSGVWLSGRKEVLINVEGKAEAQQPQACLPTHAYTHNTHTLPSKQHRQTLTAVHYCTGEPVCSYKKSSDWEQISTAVEVLKQIHWHLLLYFTPPGHETLFPSFNLNLNIIWSQDARIACWKPKMGIFAVSCLFRHQAILRIHPHKYCIFSPRWASQHSFNQHKKHAFYLMTSRGRLIWLS